MRSRLFTPAAGASLLILAGVSVAWVRSYFASHMLAWDQSHGGVNANVSRGRVAVFRFTIGQRTTDALRHETGPPDPIRTGRPPWAETYWHTPLFTYRGGASPAVGMAYWDAIVPCWLLWGLASVLPAAWFARFRVRRRRARREGFQVVVEPVDKVD